MSLISIIVPVYNVEKYISRCVDSLVNQTYSNLEIILVNDGSTDSCARICNDYAIKDRRIKVFHQKNKGLSAARNVGLKIATADFIGFVDSDDWIDINMYQILFDKIIQTKSEIAECGVSLVYDHHIHKNIPKNSKTIYGTEDALKELIKGGVFKTHVWNKLYRKKVLDKIMFPPGKINEDEFWTYLVFANAKKITYVPQTLYNYLQRVNSIMGSYSIHKIDAVEGMFERMVFMKNTFPNLYLESKLVVFRACLNNYQMILHHKLDGDNIAKKKLINYRKNLPFSLKEFNQIKKKEVLLIVLSCISLHYTSLLKLYTKHNG